MKIFLYNPRILPRVILSYFRIDMLSLLRNINALIFTLILPPILFLSCGYATHMLGQIASVSAFVNYAVQTVALMSLGIQVSAERHSPWTLYVRTLPMNYYVRFLGAVLSVVARSLLGIVVVLCMGYGFGYISLPISTLLYIIVIALVGALPMSLLGIAFGNLMGPASARGFLVIANMILFAGMFLPPDMIEGTRVFMLIPTYQWRSLVLSYYIGSRMDLLIAWSYMLLTTGIFYIFARWAYLRQRNIRFS